MVRESGEEERRALMRKGNQTSGVRTRKKERIRARQVLRTSTSSRTGTPAGLKHITKRRKRTNRDPLSNGERSGESSGRESERLRASSNCGLEGRRHRAGARGPSPLERGAGEGESPVQDLGGTAPVRPCHVPGESGCLGMQPQAGGRFHPKLNTCRRPIANKYRAARREIDRRHPLLTDSHEPTVRGNRSQPGVRPPGDPPPPAAR